MNVKEEKVMGMRSFHLEKTLDHQCDQNRCPKHSQKRDLVMPNNVNILNATEVCTEKKSKNDEKTKNLT